jgi:hypothetical protein
MIKLDKIINSPSLAFNRFSLSLHRVQEFRFFGRFNDSIIFFRFSLIINKMLASLVFLGLVGLASAAVEEHKVTTLPGFVGKLPSTHYSGCKRNTCRFASLLFLLVFSS